RSDSCFCVFTHPPTSPFYPLSLHDALPIFGEVPTPRLRPGEVLLAVKATALNRADLSQAAGNYPPPPGESEVLGLEAAGAVQGRDRKSTRLNSSHVKNSYAVFCLKKKKKKK